MNHQILVIFPFRITAVSGRQTGVEKEKIHQLGCCLDVPKSVAKSKGDFL